MMYTTLALALALSATAAPGPTSAAPSQAAPIVVHMRDFTFAPRTLRVAAGTVVTFVNDDSEAHTARASDGSFSSGGLDYHDSWRHAFAKPGTFAYFCELHPYMKGTIVVVRAGENA